MKQKLWICLTACIMVLCLCGAAMPSMAEDLHWEQDTDETHFEALFPAGQDGSQGWWYNPVTAEQSFTVDFTSHTWFDGILSYAYGGETSVPFLVELFDYNGGMVASVEYTHTGNSYMNIDFGKAIAPGDYEIMWTVQPFDGESYWVVACTPADPDREDLVYVTAPEAQIGMDLSNYVPWMKLHKTEASDSLPTPEETPAQGDTSTQKATPVQEATPTQKATPTQEVTSTPEATKDSGANTANPTPAKLSASKSTQGAGQSKADSSTAMIVGIIIGAVVIAGSGTLIAVMLIRKKKS